MLQKVIEILSEYIEISQDEITSDSALVADLELSSLDVINVMVAFEEKFNIEISEQAIKELTTVGDVVKYLKR